MASFMEELWNSIFTPGPTPSLLIATNVTFAALQFLLLILLVTTYSIHFVVLSILSAGLWYAINWFAREIQAAKAEQEAAAGPAKTRKKSPEPGSSDTETEVDGGRSANKKKKDMMPPPPPPRLVPSPSSAASLKPMPSDAGDELRKRLSFGDSYGSGSGYVSTDSEWEKVSDVGEKDR